MTIQGYGYGVLDEGSAWRLDRKLAQLVDEGFSHAEVRPEGWQVWQGGQIENRRLARLTAVLNKYRPHLDYVMQLPTAVNLFEPGCQEKQLRLLQQGLKVGQHIGASLLLYQPGYRPLRPATNFMAMHELMAQERIILHQLADEAAAWDSQVAVTMADYLATGNCTYAILPELLAHQIKMLDHQRIGLCLDFSQLYLAASWCGFDYMQGVQRLLPLATHFHLQDTGYLKENPGLPKSPVAQAITYLPRGWRPLYRDIWQEMPLPESMLIASARSDAFSPLAAYPFQQSQRPLQPELTAVPT